MFKNYIQKKLEGYVRKYLAAHPEIKLVAVGGSVGKTSTKTMIATVLAQKYRVRMRDDNHNTHMSAPLAILGIEYPENIRSIFSWFGVFRAARKRIKASTDVDVIVQELGTDRIGEIAHFGTYLRPNIGVVTAVTAEHMEFFQTIENVAAEEIALANFSELALINRDDIEGRFAELLTDGAINTYGTTSAAEYRFEIGDFTVDDGYKGAIIAPEFATAVNAQVKVLGEHSLRPVTAAVAVAIKLGLSPDEIVQGLATIHAVPGRMNVLRGVEHSTLIDDTYNSSPAAAAAALQTLYSIQAPQRIALLGDMNELGTISDVEHQKLGQLCDPNLLAWVITVGPQSEKFLAPAARARGCQVKSFANAIDAGAFAHSVIEEDAVLLAKGSQGGIFLEEALKLLLHETTEDRQLVRQSDAWRLEKDKHFARFK
ncbi:MAG TPA: UDP-N-acetylmuramoyl-tripeptide--D-alanyl-D-alanine ligase [Candidatus Saccharimonadales bacterium]